MDFFPEPAKQNRIEIQIYNPWKFHSSPLKISHPKRKTIILFRVELLNFGVFFRTKAHQFPVFTSQTFFTDKNTVLRFVDLTLKDKPWKPIVTSLSMICGFAKMFFRGQICNPGIPAANRENSCGWWWAFPCFKHTRLRSMSCTKKQFARMHRVVEGWC